MGLLDADSVTPTARKPRYIIFAAAITVCLITGSTFVMLSPTHSSPSSALVPESQKAAAILKRTAQADENLKGKPTFAYGEGEFFYPIHLGMTPKEVSNALPVLPEELVGKPAASGHEMDWIVEKCVKPIESDASRLNWKMLCYFSRPMSFTPKIRDITGAPFPDVFWVAFDRSDEHGRSLFWQLKFSRGIEVFKTPEMVMEFETAQSEFRSLGQPEFVGHNAKMWRAAANRDDMASELVSLSATQQGRAFVVTVSAGNRGGTGTQGEAFSVVPACPSGSQPYHWQFEGHRVFACKYRGMGEDGRERCAEFEFNDWSETLTAPCGSRASQFVEPTPNERALSCPASRQIYLWDNSKKRMNNEKSCLPPDWEVVLPPDSGDCPDGYKPASYGNSDLCAGRPLR